MAAACQGGSMALKFVRQEPQLGTGHAVQQAVPALAGDGMVIVLSGDVPLTQADTLRALVDAADGQRLALLTVRLPDPTGYGRIVRGEDGTVQRIVEQRMPMTPSAPSRKSTAASWPCRPATWPAGWPA